MTQFLHKITQIHSLLTGCTKFQVTIRTRFCYIVAVFSYISAQKHDLGTINLNDFIPFGWGKSAEKFVLSTWGTSIVATLQKSAALFTSSRPCRTRVHIALLTAAPRPSLEPFPCHVSRRTVSLFDVKLNFLQDEVIQHHYFFSSMFLCV